MKSILLYLFLTCLLIPVTAQDPVHKITIAARVKKDTIVLRWAPTSIPAWQTGNKYGYTVTRYTIARDGIMVTDGLSKGEQCTPQPLIPAPESVFETLSKSIPEAGVVQEAIYGKDFQMPDPQKGFTSFLKSYQELESRFGFSLFVCDLSTEIAAAAGLYFADTNIRPGERYAYRIAMAQQPQGLEIQPGVKVVDAGKTDQIPVPDELKALFADKSVSLRWPVMLHRGIFTAYILEKSTDNKNFRPVSDLPLVTASETEESDFFVYRDSLQQNYVPVYYRVRGITPFGERSMPSQTVSGAGSTDFAAYAVIDTASVTGENQVHIGWRVTETAKGQVKNITLQRAAKPDGLFEDVAALTAATRTYTDTKAIQNNYYRVMLGGEKEQRSYSFTYYIPTEDNDPPAPPTYLTGIVDLTGVVMLAWQENTEPDMMGYRVFRANALHEDFVEVTRRTVNDPTYQDTINLNTLTQHIHYRLVAVDRRYNNSGYSESVQLTRPDTIAPAPAIFTSVEVSGNEAVLKLEGSPSNDVAAFTLYRTTQWDSTRISVQEWPGDHLPQQYTDRLPSGGYYTYVLETKDYSGNIARNSRTCYSAAAIAPLNLTIRQQSRTVMLDWQLPEHLKAKEVTVYRAASGAPLSTYQRSDTDTRSATDNEVEMAIEYTYRIKVLCNNGQSVLSQTKKIIINE